MARNGEPRGPVSPQKTHPDTAACRHDFQEKTAMSFAQNTN